MNNIKILISKTFKPNKIDCANNFILSTPIIDHICQYSNLITTNASNSNGFIKSQSYWDLGGNKIDDDNDDFLLNNTNRIITLSEWESIEDWNKWFNSDIRININNKFHFLNITTETSHMYPKLLFKDVALL